MTHSHKTRQGAQKAAHADLGAEALEGVDFTLRNTGAGWIAIRIPAANHAAEEAQGKRLKSPNRSMGAKAGHGKRQAAKSETAAAKRHAHPTSSQVQRAKARDAEPRSFKPAQTRTEQLVAMMSRPQGATSKAMEEATGWAPHSVRGLIGMLKKRGVQVISDKVQGSPTAYRIAPKPDEIGDVL